MSIIKYLAAALLLGNLTSLFAQNPDRPSKAPSEYEGTVSVDRLRAIYDDDRVTKFLRAVKDEFGAECVNTSPTAPLKARIRRVGSGDFGSIFYDFTESCGQSLGLTAIGINAEFVGPNPKPLNLIVSIHLKK